MSLALRRGPKIGPPRRIGSPRSLQLADAFGTTASRLEVAGIVVIAAYVTGLVWLIGHTDYDLWGGFLFAPLLFVFTAPVLVRMLRRVGEDISIQRIFVLGLAVKLLVAFARYYVTFVIIGRGDAQGYHLAGIELSEEFRAFELGGPAFQTHVGWFVGTPFIRLITGSLYTVTGPTRLGGFVFFAWMSFWGIYLFYRAYRIGVPDGNNRRYLLLLILLPSLVFWPSSIGKDAWMLLMLGLTAYGVARVLARRRVAYPFLVAGLVGLSMVRPHITLIVFVALSVAYLLRRTDKTLTGGITAKVIGVVLLLVAGTVIVGQVQSFFGLEGFDSESVDAALGETTRRSSQGGSQFEAVQVTSPQQLPIAAVTVLFRPFPHEANNIQALISAAEGTFMIILFALGLSRLAKVPARMFTTPYVAFAVSYALAFIFAFSAIGNFGILVRQRVQLLPIVIILLAEPTRSAVKARADRLRRAAGRSDPALARAAPAGD